MPTWLSLIDFKYLLVLTCWNLINFVFFVFRQYKEPVTNSNKLPYDSLHCMLTQINLQIRYSILNRGGIYWQKGTWKIEGQKCFFKLLTFCIKAPNDDPFQILGIKMQHCLQTVKKTEVLRQLMYCIAKPTMV